MPMIQPITLQVIWPLSLYGGHRHRDAVQCHQGHMGLRGRGLWRYIVGCERFHNPTACEEPEVRNRVWTILITAIWHSHRSSLSMSVRKRMSAVDSLKHPWLLDSGSKQRQNHSLSKSKDKMKKFIARRKWQVGLFAYRTSLWGLLSYSQSHSKPTIHRLCF